MKRVLATLVLVLLLPVSAEAAASCAAKGSTTVRKNNLVRVFERGPTGSEKLVACFRPSGERRRLAQNFDDDLYETETWSAVRLWRRFVTWTFERTDSSCKADCPPGYGYWVTKYVRDVRTGTGTDVPDGFELGRSFVVTRAKVVATIRRREVRTPDRVLDTGVDPGSLDVSGARVTWLKDGEPRSALP